MYWYHPHVHMQSEGQVLSALTGAIIVEGIKKFNKQAAQLPERIFVLRDMEVPENLEDSKAPSKDISINMVPINYKGDGTYNKPAVILMNSNEQQFWRVANTAAVTAKEGTVEEWTIENRAPEIHAFHIHQIHFLVQESPNPSEVGILLDTVSISAWDGKSTNYPKVKLKMDFRGANKDSSIAGTFLYHCHILKHEDGGMMAPIQITS